MSEAPSKQPPLFFRILYHIEDGLLVTVLSTMILIAFAQIVLRNFANSGIVWADAFLRYLVLWIGMTGAMVATREYNHISVDIVSYLLKGRPKTGVRLVTDLFTAIVSSFLFLASVQFIKDEASFGGKAFASVPTWLAEIILPVAFGVIALRYIGYFVRDVIRLIKGGDDEPSEYEQEDGQ
jgi:TRAP-type C4-dicarboxylate transport system permease small subunit